MTLFRSNGKDKKVVLKEHSMKICIAIISCILLATSLFAAGETGLAVLKVGVGARATAMGEAFVASADDASGIYWNPAGSAWIKNRQAHFSHNSWIQGINHNVASLTFPTKVGSFGVPDGRCGRWYRGYVQVFLSQIVNMSRG